MKFQEFIKSASPHTLRAYRGDLAQAFMSCKNDKIPNFGREIIVECRKAQMSWIKLGPASRNRKAASLKSFLSYLFAENITETDLSLQIQTPSVPRKIPNFLSVDEISACLQSFTDQDNSQEKVLFLLIYGAGLRVSEACHLSTKDFQPQYRSLRILGKGNKERIVVLPKSVAKLLQKNINTDEFIWGNKPLCTRKAYEWVRTRGLKAGLVRPLHPHALRHSFATHLLSSGANLRVLQELLGHESLVATERYTHLGVDQLARTMEQHHPLGHSHLKKR